MIVPPVAKGEKTRHWITVETDTGKIVKSGNSTGKTFGFAPTLSDYFESSRKLSKNGKCMVMVTMSGYGQQLLNPFLGPINWDFTFEIDIEKNEVNIVEGKHDGYPTYRVHYGPNFYEFKELTPARLNDPMEIVVDKDGKATDTSLISN